MHQMSWVYWFGGLLCCCLAACVPPTPPPTVQPATPEARVSATPFAPLAITATMEPSPLPSPLLPEPTFTPPPAFAISKQAIAAYREPVVQPDDWIAQVPAGQTVQILETVTHDGQKWYRCMWEVNGLKLQGWVLARYFLLLNDLENLNKP